MDPADDKPESPAAKRILIVEDELMIRLLLEDMLGDLGYTVAGEAARVQDALADIVYVRRKIGARPITRGPQNARRHHRRRALTLGTGDMDRLELEGLARRVVDHEPDPMCE